jgi:metallo-beta-lactamase class B
MLSAVIAASCAAGAFAAQAPAEQAPSAQQVPPAPPTPPAPVNPWSEAVPDNLEAHIAAATKAAGLDLWGILELCLPREPGGTPRPADDRAQPTKVFDNLYYLGMKSVSAWAVTTSDGIILIDTLDNQMEAESFIEGGLRQLRLDPSQIRQIIITHGHADHYGGAQYLADKYKAELVMSEADWDFLAGPRAPQLRLDRGPIPRRGRAVNDGDRLTLGDTTIELYVTPPHTPGTLSLILPLKDGAKSNVGALWGGTAFNFEPTVQNFAAYAASAERFAKIASDKGADTPLSNHPTYDEALVKMEMLQKRAAEQPHPFATGPISVVRYLRVAQQCALARGRAMVEPRVPTDPSGLIK